MLVQYPFPHHLCHIEQNIHIAYMDEGKGEQTMLFLHGLGNYAPVWTNQIAAFKADYRCIALDLPGNGYSSRGEYPYTLFFYAETIVQFIQKMQLKKVVMCGHSLGGQIALIIALRFPELLDRLILIAPAGFESFAPHEVMMMQGMINMGNLFTADEYHLESAINQSFFAKNAASGVIIDELKQIMNSHPLKNWRDMNIASINAMLKEQVHPYLSQIKLPVFTIIGDKDRMIPNTLIHFGESPEGIVRKATSLMPNASYNIIKNGGHFVQIEKYQEVNDAIKAFVPNQFIQQS